MGLFSSEPASHFPPAEGRRLDGTDVSLPDDLPADATLVVVLFRDELDPLADQWARLGDRLAETYGERVATLEAPVVNKKLKVFGKLTTVGIRGQVETEDERDRTVPLFVDVKAFRKELGLKSTGDVYAFLLDRDGRIAWRGEGDIDMEEVEDLEAAVREVLAAADGEPEVLDLDAPSRRAPQDEAAGDDRQPEDDRQTDAPPPTAAGDPPPAAA